MKRLNIFTSSIILGGVSLISHVQAAEFAALAIDRNNGFAYGWSHGQASLALAEQRAVEECKKRTDKSCTIVLAWSGNGCGVYRTVEASVGTAYGWGIAPTQSEADKIAHQNALKRSNGKVAPNQVWACNSTDKTKLKVIKNKESNVKTVKIGSQVWMSENLNATHFNNGDVIPFARNDDEWLAATTKPISRAFKDNSSQNKEYGRYYNWYAATDPRGICPTGFHLPSEKEWKVLFKTVAPKGIEITRTQEYKSQVVAPKLKSQYGWEDNNGTDNFGFHALPAGNIHYRGYETTVGTMAHFWTSTSDNNKNAWEVNLWNHNNDAAISYLGNKVEGKNIRCIQD
ncbi:FISUMP domain-containing protein [Acinetobacter indicus]|uniref:FISUMP domain-containing protein n=1 Tax=Acinetobacter indicus TaxID=756892 RepID=UPI000CEC7892|nr:FISUMP domain-containing protein [Acinetobacter indicus]